MNTGQKDQEPGILREGNAGKKLCRRREGVAKLYLLPLFRGRERLLKETRSMKKRERTQTERAPGTVRQEAQIEG